MEGSISARVKAGLLPLTGEMEGTSLTGMVPAGVLIDAHLVHVGVAEEDEADDVGELGEGGGEGIGGEKHYRGLAGADIAMGVEGGVGVDAGRDVCHDPGALVGDAGGGELGAEPRDLLSWRRRCWRCRCRRCIAWTRRCPGGR